jgi:hypothetical protein
MANFEGLMTEKMEGAGEDMAQRRWGREREAEGYYLQGTQEETCQGGGSEKDGIWIIAPLSITRPYAFHAILGAVVPW